MTTERPDIPWGQAQDGGTYHGFSSAPPDAPPVSPRRRVWRAPRALTIAGGVIGAVAFGLALGFLAKPDLGHSTAGAPMHAVAPATGAMNIEVNSPPPPPPARPAGKLEVLPPDLARGATPPTETSAPDYTPPAATPVPSLAAVEPACAAARSRAAQMVCGDPDLAAADRTLNQAYRRALRSGAAPEQLRQDQRDWLAIREDAALRSPQAVASVYDQRIEELNQIAEDGPGEN